MFWLFPDVEIAIKTSPSLPRASTCRENISLNEKSLPHAVMIDVSVFIAIAGNAALNRLNLTTN